MQLSFTVYGKGRQPIQMYIFMYTVQNTWGLNKDSSQVYVFNAWCPVPNWPAVFGGSVLADLPHWSNARWIKHWNKQKNLRTYVKQWNNRVPLNREVTKEW